jgi:hypothetical protein
MSIVVGLAVMVALVAGVFSVALAKPTPPTGGSGSSPLMLGVSNTANAVTHLINSSTGAALDLQVKLPIDPDAGPPPDPPLTVNSNTKVDKLNADTVDGKDSFDFASAQAGRTYVNKTHITPYLDNWHADGDATCDRGDKMLSGGYALDGVVDVAVHQSSPNLGPDPTWILSYHRADHDQTQSAGGATVYVLCDDTAQPAHI